MTLADAARSTGRRRPKRRVVGIVLALLGPAFLGLTGFLAWLSWIEPHSDGIHPADRLPLFVLALTGGALTAAGAWLLGSGRSDHSRPGPVDG